MGRTGYCFYCGRSSTELRGGRCLGCRREALMRCGWRPPSEPLRLAKCGETKLRKESGSEWLPHLVNHGARKAAEASAFCDERSYDYGDD